MSWSKSSQGYFLSLSTNPILPHHGTILSSLDWPLVNCKMRINDIEMWSVWLETVLVKHVITLPLSTTEFGVMAVLCQCQFSSHGHTRNTETCSSPSFYCSPSASLPRCWATPTNLTAHTQEWRTGRPQASLPEPCYFLCRGWLPIFRYIYIINISHITYIMIWWHTFNQWSPATFQWQEDQYFEEKPYSYSQTVKKWQGPRLRDGNHN